ncbi:MAG: 50S ribosomal protein L30 [Candidatus Competibacteraceae bacterium]|uniref:Large ribosomal subunit protein uL30 n=1 Tax=Candidatus Contendobacter odensis Run_B_J11 TaxID=1400861 RepID=A0A7U7GBM8_9GAMM|nr:50S ribosomal protein L30 [Candidatus Competibacteraceae bacterium]MBK8753609.1 50S ribosomal protein L30 [Candidatus Competibacteraceae bacterium]CDH45287.1 50S ribosomal subunit protein L30 [Candidatus Contendobacter odensis Run_B_J11]
MVDKLKVTLVKSAHGRLAAHKACVRGLGLRRTQSSAMVIDTPENRGMIRKVSYLLKVEETSNHAS